MSAIISVCGDYRYTLSRTIGVRGGGSVGSSCTACERPALFIMFNPSTADATVNDPTIRRVIRFCESWSCTSLVVVNVFAYRATDPKELGVVVDPTGPDNDKHITEQLNIVGSCQFGLTVAAWGSGAARYPERMVRMNELLHAYTVHCLGTNKDGSPKHPLYMPASMPLKVWKHNIEDNRIGTGACFGGIRKC